MRVKITGLGEIAFGEFVGLVTEHEDVLAAVRMDGYGLFLRTLHPSRVSMVTPEEEARMGSMP